MPNAKKTHAQRKEQIEAELVFEGGAYLNPDGSVDGETLLEFVRQSPGVFSLLILSAVIYGDTELHENTESDYHRFTEEIVSGLAAVIERAFEGDERSAIQLKAIEKLIRPEKFELPASKIKELVDRYETSPPLARAWELRRLMSALSNVVEPIKSTRSDSINEPIRLMETPIIPYYSGLWNLAQKNWKPNTTLQSLAIRVYLKHLQDAGITGEGSETITDRTLKRDLATARQWEQDANEGEKRRRGRYKGEAFSDSSITWFDFSEGWKVRKVRARKKRTGNRQRDKLS